MATAWRFRRKVLLGVLDVSAASCTNKEPWHRSCLLFLHGLHIQYIAFFTPDIVTTQLDGCTFEVIANPLFGLLDNKAFSLAFG
ncbi:MAG: hypothetical protein K0Q83_2479 [Deltaproteobacteria bacterium]|nr:hypothetical protein [Deltaproteobacteria bacterium]